MGIICGWIIYGVLGESLWSVKEDFKVWGLSSWRDGGVIFFFKRGGRGRFGRV